MSRYEKGRKEETHKRLVKLASEKFRAEGIDAVGIAGLMGEAGLTHGGFYAHFASKDALVDEAIGFALSQLPAHFTGLESADRELRSFIDWYLSPAHRDLLARGCALAALAPDLGRRSKGSRTTFMEAASSTVDAIAGRLPEALSMAQRRNVAFAVLSQLVGCLQMARLAADKSDSQSLLEAGREAAYLIAGIGSPRDGAESSPRRSKKKSS